jgi:hypothetical protein
MIVGALKSEIACMSIHTYIQLRVPFRGTKRRGFGQKPHARAMPKKTLEDEEGDLFSLPDAGEWLG